jgi:GGDEF domain-containing protein
MRRPAAANDRAAADRLRARQRYRARLGGDGFVILLHNQGNSSRACAETFIAQQMRKLVDAIGAPMILAGSDAKVSCSIGVAAYPQDGGDSGRGQCLGQAMRASGA